MNIGANSKEQLKSYVDRIVSLEEQKAETAADIKDVLTEAKSNGYDAAALRAVVKERMQDKAKRDKAAERAAIIDTYKAALGMLSDLPLGQAAIDRVSE